MKIGAIENILKKKKPYAGDVLFFRYIAYGLSYSFVGILIALRKKIFFYESFLIFRNVISKVAVEICCPAFLIYSWELRGHSKKAFKYPKSKLFYLRSKKNNQSFVKPY